MNFSIVKNKKPLDSIGFIMDAGFGDTQQLQLPSLLGASLLESLRSMSTTGRFRAVKWGREINKSTRGRKKERKKEGKMKNGGKQFIFKLLLSVN